MLGRASLPSIFFLFKLLLAILPYLFFNKNSTYHFAQFRKTKPSRIPVALNVTCLWWHTPVRAYSVSLHLVSSCLMFFHNFLQMSSSLNKFNSSSPVILVIAHIAVEYFFPFQFLSDDCRYKKKLLQFWFPGASHLSTFKFLIRSNTFF